MQYLVNLNNHIKFLLLVNILNTLYLSLFISYYSILFIFVLCTFVIFFTLKKTLIGWLLNFIGFSLGTIYFLISFYMTILDALNGRPNEIFSYIRHVSGFTSFISFISIFVLFSNRTISFFNLKNSILHKINILFFGNGISLRKNTQIIIYIHLLLLIFYIFAPSLLTQTILFEASIISIIHIFFNIVSILNIIFIKKYKYYLTTFYFSLFTFLNIYMGIKGFILGLIGTNNSDFYTTIQMELPHFFIAFCGFYFASYIYKNFIKSTESKSLI